MRKPCLSYVFHGNETRKFQRAVALLVCLGFSATLFATDKPKRDSVVYDFIFAGGKFQNQFTFLGRNFGQHVPFVTSDLSYYTNFNVWLSASSFHFFDSSLPFQGSIAVGYNGELSKKIDYNVSYTEFLIPPTGQLSRLQSLGFIQATIGLDWKYVYSTLQTQVMTYSQSDVFITSQHSRYFEFNQKLFRKIKVSFQPVVSLTVGTSKFNYSDDEALVGRGPINPRALLGSGNGNGGGIIGNGNGSGIPGTGTSGGNGNSNGGNGNGNPGGQGSGNSGGNGNSGSGQGNGNGGGGQGNGNSGSGQGNGNSGGNAGQGNGTNTGNGGSGSGTNGAGSGNGNGGTGSPVVPSGTETANELGLLNWEIAMPINFKLGNFNLEWGTRYTHPLHVIENDLSRPAFIQSVDLFYTIPVKRKKRIG